MSVAAATVILFDVGVPLTTGADNVAPSPLAIEAIVTIPEGLISDVALVTCDEGIFADVVSVRNELVAEVGVPFISIRTVVPLSRNAVPALSPEGKFVTVKFDADMLFEYVPQVSVYTTLAPLTA